MPLDGGVVADLKKDGMEILIESAWKRHNQFSSALNSAIRKISEGYKIITHGDFQKAEKIMLGGREITITFDRNTQRYYIYGYGVPGMIFPAIGFVKYEKEKKHPTSGDRKNDYESIVITLEDNRKFRIDKEFNLIDIKTNTVQLLVASYYGMTNHTGKNAQNKSIIEIIMDMKTGIEKILNDEKMQITEDIQIGKKIVTILKDSNGIYYFTGENVPGLIFPKRGFVKYSISKGKVTITFDDLTQAEVIENFTFRKLIAVNGKKLSE